MMLLLAWLAPSNAVYLTTTHDITGHFLSELVATTAKFRYSGGS